MNEMDARIIIEARGGGGASFACEPGYTILAAGLRAGVGFPYECNSGSCGSCAFELLEGKVVDAWDQAPGLESARRARGYRLACQSQPLSDCRLKVRLRDHFKPVFAPSRCRAVLQSRIVIAPNMEEFRFHTQMDAKFLPGQYAMLRLPEVFGARAYSMCNLPNDDREWNFIIKRMPKGAATSVLFNKLAPGAEIGFEGPFGLAYLRPDTARDIVLIAGGSGLSPILSIARAAVGAEELNGRRIRLFHGVRDVADLCTKRLLAEELLLGERIELIEAVSGGNVEADGWTGERGFIHDVLARGVGPDAALADYYFCGPPLMTDAVNKFLALDLRIPAAQLHFDRFY